MPGFFTEIRRKYMAKIADKLDNIGDSLKTSVRFLESPRRKSLNYYNVSNYIQAIFFIRL